MNIEYEVKSILRSGGTPEVKAELIMSFSNFNKEDIIKAVKIGGNDVSDIYGNLIRFDKKEEVK